MWDPAGYRQAKSVIPDYIEQVSSRIDGNMNWKSNETILDYGCGEGQRTARYLLPKAEKLDSVIYGVDIAKQMIDFAINNHRSPKVKFVVGDIMQEGQFPLGDIQPFDKIFAFYVLHWIKDYRGALQRFYDVLKPGGELCFFSIVKGVQFHLLRKFGEDPKWSGYMKGFERFIPEWIENFDTEPTNTIRKTMEDIGYEVIDFVPISPKIKTKFESYSDFYLTLNPFLGMIPEHLFPEFKQDHDSFLRNFNGISDFETGVTLSHDTLFSIVRKPMTV